jgi:hypothetical protein
MWEFVFTTSLPEAYLFYGFVTIILAKFLVKSI